MTLPGALRVATTTSAVPERTVAKHCSIAVTSAERSASANASVRPVAASMPVRTDAPLPRLTSWRRTVARSPVAASASAAIPAVPSVLPSSTKRISVFSSSSREPARRSIVRRMRAGSWYRGITSVRPGPSREGGADDTRRAPSSSGSEPICGGYRLGAGSGPGPVHGTGHPVGGFRSARGARGIASFAYGSPPESIGKGGYAYVGSVLLVGEDVEQLAGRRLHEVVDVRLGPPGRRCREGQRLGGSSVVLVVVVVRQDAAEGVGRGAHRGGGGPVGGGGGG